MSRYNHKNIRDSYSKYLDIADNPVDIKTYANINKKYNKFLIDKALDGHVVTLPARMGTLNIQGKYQEIKIIDGKIHGLAPNWAETKKLWDRNAEAKERKQIVYCTNADTDGIRYKWVWSKLNILVENKKVYSLILTRENKRSVYAKIKEGFKNYIVK